MKRVYGDNWQYELNKMQVEAENKLQRDAETSKRFEPITNNLERRFKAGAAKYAGLLNIFGAGFPRNFIPSFSWGGAAGITVYMTRKAFETARLVMSRRNIDFDEKEAAILQHVFDETKIWRKE